MAQERFIEFEYKKDGASAPKKYNVLVLNRPSEFLEGISLENLTADEIDKLKAAQKVFEEMVAPYIAKSYRRFKPSGIIRS